MRDWNFGSVDGRQLTVRVFSPSEFDEWRGGRWRFSWGRLLVKRLWYYAIFCRSNYRVWLCWRRNMNHRCYCRVGTLLDVSVVMAGFGVVCFYSFYQGPSPCACDKVISEMFGDN